MQAKKRPAGALATAQQATIGTPSQQSLQQVLSIPANTLRARRPCKKSCLCAAAAPLGGRADKKPKRGRAAARGEAAAPEDMAFDAPSEQPEPLPGGGDDAAPAPMDLDMKIVHEPIIVTKVNGI